MRRKRNEGRKKCNTLPTLCGDVSFLFAFELFSTSESVHILNWCTNTELVNCSIDEKRDELRFSLTICTEMAIDVKREREQNTHTHHPYSRMTLV